MAIMSLRSRSRVKASMVLTRADHLCIHNYIRSLLNIILKPILMVRSRLDPHPSACVSDALANRATHAVIYIYIYIYIYMFINTYKTTYTH